MMALNRHRLKHLVSKKALGASKTQQLLSNTEQLLSVVLIGNNLINVIIPVLTTTVALRLFGNHSLVLSVTTGVVAFFIIIFAEITPKIVGATFPDKIALPASIVIAPLTRLARPLVWFVNLFVSSLLRLLHIDTHAARNQDLTSEEIRSIVLESGSYLPPKHRSILVNLFELDSIEVEDVMVPRARIEALDIDAPLQRIIHQIETCYHNKLLVYEKEIDRVVGVLQVRKVLAAMRSDEFDTAALRELLRAPYFIPGGTPVFQQLQFFQEHHQRVGVVVNEYGEVQGLVTPEDIIEELIGEFTTSVPGAGGHRMRWDDKGECVVSGQTALRELNRALRIKLPLNGPKTINGLILETLTQLPEGDVCLSVGEYRLEVMQFDAQTIRTVRLMRPRQVKRARTGAR